MKNLEPVLISGEEVLPIVEGGKGIAVSNGISAGAFAAAGAVGTFSGVNADTYDEEGRPHNIAFKGTTRKERFEELIAQSIEGGIAQARLAHEMAGGKGRLHMNTLWEAGGTETILRGVLDGSRGLIHGITCGAGLPYRMAQIAAEFQVYYYPIVSSARAFGVLWRRSYRKLPELLGGVVYEDPWRAGGHNGLSNTEDPLVPEDPLPRVRELRTLMNSVGLDRTPILMAGGVWYLRDFEDWIDNPELGPIVFQLGTRPLLTKESPIPIQWKERLRTIKKGDVFLNRFSPTGFYSSAVNNPFLKELAARSERQISYSRAADDQHDAPLPLGPRGRPVYVAAADLEKAKGWMDQGFGEAMKTPDDTLIFVDETRKDKILFDQQDCMGCLSACRFSNWSTNEAGTTGRRPDPRSFCIQKTLQRIVHNGDIDNQLMFAGHNVYKFSEDPFYNNDFTPTVAELIDRLITGD